MHYFDETDGVSDLSILVNGVEIDSWEWSKSLGSAIVNQKTATFHLTDDVRLQNGDVVSLVGHADGREPLRIDYVEFEPDLMIA